MKKYLLNKLLACGLFVVSSLIIEAFMFLYLGFGFLPTYLIFDISLILFVAFFVLFLPVGRAQGIIFGFFLFVQIILSYANICINTALGNVFTFEMLSLVDETARVVTFEMLPIWPMVFYLLMFVMDVTFLVLIRKKIVPQNVSYRTSLRFIVKNIALFGVTLSYVLYSSAVFMLVGEKNDDLYLFSDRVLYSNFSSTTQSLKKFGTWGFYFEEFFRRFYVVDNAVTYSRAELKAFKESAEYDPTTQKLYGVSEGKNVVVLMLESFEWYAIDAELTPTLYALANGYDFGVRDEETGLYTNFDYYNFETNEDGSTELTRSDYLMVDGEYVKIPSKSPLDESKFGTYGITLTNYYSKSKTDYSEASAILGNYPYNKSFTTHGGILGYSSKNLYSDVDYCFSLPSLLKNTGAVDVTKYMHGYLSTFYGRDTLIPQFGFDHSLFLDQMSETIEKGDKLAHIVKDSDILDYYLNQTKTNKFIPDDKSFLSFYTTVTTHGEYDYNPYLAENYKFLDAVGYLGEKKGENDVGLSDEWASKVRSYFASALDTEHAVTLLIKYLMENNLFEDTMLVLFSDHQSYYDGMDLEYKKHYFSDNGLGYSSPMAWMRDEEYGEEYNEFSQDRYLIPAMIYDTNITDAVVGAETDSHFVDKFTCAFDLPVTIFNLLGLDYKPSMYLGYPVFCETLDRETGEVIELSVPAYISCTGGIFDLNVYTEDGVNVKYAKTETAISEYMKKFSYKVTQYIEKWYKITYLYEYDMFK